jgi:hypothetical protein
MKTSLLSLALVAACALTACNKPEATAKIWTILKGFRSTF